MRLDDILVKCDRCAAEVRLDDAPDDWNAVFKDGRVIGHLCPGCQTPEENAEAEINAATMDYSRGGWTDDGRLHAPPKGLPATKEEILEDLWERTDVALTKIAMQIQLTGKAMPRNAIVDEVEDNLPPGYPEIKTSLGLTRRHLIKEIIKDMLEQLEGGDAA